MEVFSIGTKDAAAADFFGRLRAARIRRVVDLRHGQFGFGEDAARQPGHVRAEDMRFFLKALCNAEYVCDSRLVPPDDLHQSLGFVPGECQECYARVYRRMLESREIASHLTPDTLKTRTAFLSANHLSKDCHACVLLQYLREHWPELSIVHL